jgi:peptidyl-prolyl cis-trans isomerase B (cyclophilin B)
VRPLIRIATLVFLAMSVAAGPAAAQERPVVLFDTGRGSFEMELFADEAPQSVAHILTLVRRNFYNGLRVHRVEPGFVVQFGDPNTRDMTKRNVWGTGGSGRAIGVAEIDPERRHEPGAVALAHAGDPARADSQLYVVLAASPRSARLEGRYAIIGRIVSGMDVVESLRETDLITRATVKSEAQRRP